MRNKICLMILGWLTAACMQAVNLKNCVVVAEPNEPQLVRKMADIFAHDIARVTGFCPTVTRDWTSGNSVVLTTVRNSRMLSRAGVSASDIQGGWERYKIITKGNHLVIVGSDPRGLAYGVFHVSERIGVNPWYWWADVPVKKKARLDYKENFTSKSPSVKYRGIFINDEDWGLKPWASNNYEKELGDIGPRTYSRVCELLLRLKANMLAPAMHSCTGAFYSHPESKVVCDSFNIIITTSHCEPLLLNNAADTEWNSQRDGEWNYKTNRQTIWKKWDDRLSEAAKYENIYTVAMRGVHDEGLKGNLPMEERVPLIANVIDEQRQLLEKHIGKPADQIPQIFVPYKETMDIYENGLKVPDDITLVWVDDNYGYMKRVSSPDEQKRSGGAGVYYHLSYLGAPHDYLWLCTTPPVLMYEELKKAYDAGADRYWLLNVGDIKPMELGMQTFMDMAWDFSSFNIDNVNTHQAAFLASIFGNGMKENFQTLLDDYYRLAWSRKPEYMGFEYEWDDPQHTGLRSTDFSFANYGEAQMRLEQYRQMSDKVERLSDGTPAFYQLVQFPVQAAYQMNRKFLMAQLNQEKSAEGLKAQANWAAHEMEAAYDSINSLNRRYNSLLNGKWNGIMDVPPGFCSLYQNKPNVTQHEGAGTEKAELSNSKQQPKDCAAICLTQFKNKSSNAKIINGLGYDWKVIQLGEPFDFSTQAFVEYELPTDCNADRVEVIVYTVPYWPVYKGKSNAIEISMDGRQTTKFENVFREYARSWKDQVMRNGIATTIHFPLSKEQKSHVLRIQAIDPGQMIQKIIINWGGLQKSYLGPLPAKH